MSYASNSQGDCRREIEYFSSPVLDYRGTPTGDAGVRDNRRVLNETAYRVANFRQSVTQPGRSHTLPLVTPASELSLPTFVRVINRSARPGTVRIHAIDDTGRRFGPVTMSLDAKLTRHFISRELEQGVNQQLTGLSGGVGNGSGNWRLELATELDIEALAYIRTEGGFVASVHAVAAETEQGLMRYHVPFFNPASNENQVSSLRLINPGNGAARVMITGVDDRGNAPPGGSVSLTLGGGAARTLTAEQLEEGGPGISGRFGDGVGKWQLSVSANRLVQVMSLLHSRLTGNLVNLSRGSVTQPGRSHTLPLVTPASELSLPTFVRVINRSARPGTVRIHAIDDTGRRFGPVTMSLDAKLTRHFISRELEQGVNQQLTGLSRGVGNGSGNWRLELATELDIEALAYIRTEGGFVASVHAVAAETEEGSMRYHVPFFNPASNENQVSSLRLINPGNGAARVMITGVDDRGNAPPGGSVSLTLGGGAARTLTAEQLEEGGPGISGRFGDGGGKWQLSVSANRPVQVMSLLHSRLTGNLVNLSRGQAGSSAGPPPPTSNYGAISFDIIVGCRGVAWGIATDRPSEQDALNAARQSCVSRGGLSSDCNRSSVSFPQCVALSYGENAVACGAYATGGATRSAAESTALAACRSDSDRYTDCRIVTSGSQRASACNSQGSSRDFRVSESSGSQLADRELRTP